MKESSLVKYNHEGKAEYVRADYYNFLLFSMFYCFKCGKPLVTKLQVHPSMFGYRKCTICEHVLLVDNNIKHSEFIKLERDDILSSVDEMIALIPDDRKVFRKLLLVMVEYLESKQ